MLHFLLEIIIMTRSTKTRLLLRDKCKVVHSDRLYRPLPTLSNVCDYYNIRRPIFYLPFIMLGFAEQRLDYQLIKILNVYGSMLYARKVQHLFFTHLKLL